MEQTMEKSGKEKIQKIMSALAPMFPDRRPFLNFENAFQLLVATVLSAQCTDAAVNKITPELFGNFPNPASMAEAPLPELERIVHPTGTFRVKARNIKALSRQLTERHSGEVPDTMEALTALPGVGRKTAGAVLSVVYGKPAIIVDTHFSRVAYRLGLTNSDKPEAIEKDLAAITQAEQWTEVSSVLNRFGRAVCHARKPECEKCPVRNFCIL